MSQPHTYALVTDQSLSWSVFLVLAFVLSPVRNILTFRSEKRARRATSVTKPLTPRGRRAA